MPTFRISRLQSQLLSACTLAALALIVSISPLAIPAEAQATFNGLQTTAIAKGPIGVTGIATDFYGNLYLALPGSGTVLKETLANGVYTESIIASGLSFPAAVAVNASGNVYVADRSAGIIYKETPSGGTYTQSVFATGGEPTSIAIDQYGDLFIAQGPEGRVTEISSNDGSQVVVAKGFVNASAVAVNPTGSTFYVADYAGGIYEASYDYTTGKSSQLTVDASITSVTGLACNPAGDLFVSVAGQATVSEEVSYDQGQTYTQSSVFGTFTAPRALAVDFHGNLFVGDRTTNAIDEIEYSGIDFGSVAAGSASKKFTLDFTIHAGTTLANPSRSVLTTGIANLDFIDAGGTTCIPKTYSAATECVVNVEFKPRYPGESRGELTLFDGEGNARLTLYGLGAGPQIAYSNTNVTTLATGLASPYGFAVDAAGNSYLLVTSSTQKNSTAILRISSTGAQTIVYDGGGHFDSIAVDGVGDLYTTSMDRGLDPYSIDGYTALYYFTPQGVPNLLGGLPLSGATAIALDGSGSFYAAYGYTGTAHLGGVYRCTLTTVAVPVASGLTDPGQIAIDSQNNLYIADRSLGIVKVTPQGVPSGVAAGENGAGGVAIDPAGNLYYTDSYGPVYELPVGGSPQIIGTAGLYSPLALDGSGNVYFIAKGDGDNTGTLVRINRASPPTLAFATTKTGAVSTDSPKSSSIRNIGNRTLTMASVAYPTDFPEKPSGLASDCKAGTLAPGAGCTFTIDFKPISGSGTGSTVKLSEYLTLTSNNRNAAGSLQHIALTGTEIASAKLPASLTLAASSLTPTEGSAYTITASVTGPGPVPTGNVSFYSDKVLLSTVPLTSGKAVLKPSLTAGKHTLTASYSGDAKYFTATAGALAITVDKASSKISLSASSNPIKVGATVIFTAEVPSTIAGIPPTGTVRFFSGNTLLGTVSVAGGKATFSTTKLAAGKQTITAAYSGDTHYVAANTTLSITVEKALTVLALTALPNPANVGASVAFTAKLSATIAGTPPTGTVRFFSGNTLLGTVSVAGDKATFSTTKLAAGKQTITAAYAGDTHYAAANATLSITVEKALTRPAQETKIYVR